MCQRWLRKDVAQKIKLKIGRLFDKNEAENRSPKILMVRVWEQTFHCVVRSMCVFFAYFTLHNSTNLRCGTYSKLIHSVWVRFC